MSKTLNGYLSELHRTQSQGAFVVPHEHVLAIKAGVDAREAKLVAERDRYKAGLAEIIDVFERESKYVSSFTVMDKMEVIARNALGEQKE